MIRLLLSLLALITGVAVPGMAQARDFGACGTEIGAQAEVGQAAAAEVVQPARCVALAVAPTPLESEPRWREATGPVIRPVLIGIDRARQ